MPNSTLTQNHSNNVLQYQTWEKSTTTGQEQITTQNVNVPNLTRNTQNGTVQAANFNTTASSFSSATSTTYISSLVMNGSSSGSGLSPLMQAHQATLANQNQDQANKKKEIWCEIDDPSNLLPPQPQLNVNKQPAQPAAANSRTIYALPSDPYKTGPIALEWQGDFGLLNSVVNPQIRHIDVYDPSLTMQLPKPYFNPNGQMGMYLGARDAGTNIDLGTIPGESISSLIILAVDDAPGDLFSSSPKVELAINTANEEIIDWLGNKLKSYLANTNSSSVASTTKRIVYYAQQNNRAFLIALIKDGMVKITQTSNVQGAVLAMELESNLLDDTYPFKDFMQSATTVWLKMVDWSKELTPIQESAVAAAKAAKAAPKTLAGVAKWPLINILIMGTVDKIQFNEHHESVEWLTEHWINDAFKVIAITVLVFAILRFGIVKEASGLIEKNVVNKFFTSKFFAHWVTNSLVAGFISSSLSEAGKVLGINNALSNSPLAQAAYEKSATAYEAISNSDMIQIIRLLMQDVQNPQTIEEGLNNTNWAGTLAQDYQDQAVPSSNSIPTWTNSGEDGI